MQMRVNVMDDGDRRDVRRKCWRKDGLDGLLVER